MMQLEMTQEQLISMQCQWIDSEAEQDAVQTALHHAQSSMSELQCQWITAEAQQDASQATLSGVLAEMTELRERSVCCVCLDRPRCVVLQPCWHHVLCSLCAPSLARCPICRTPIAER